MAQLLTTMPTSQLANLHSIFAATKRKVFGRLKPRVDPTAVTPKCNASAPIHQEIDTPLLLQPSSALALDGNQLFAVGPEIVKCAQMRAESPLNNHKPDVCEHC